VVQVLAIEHGPLSLAEALIRCPSVTPQEAGALDLLERVLGGQGFACTRLPFGDSATESVDNLFARFGAEGPHLCFAGHTDVVPPGDEAHWRHSPFAAAIEDGRLYGRGAVDMKGAVACFVSAALNYIRDKGDHSAGSISLLITGDEEGPAVNGTIKVLEWMSGNGQIPDHALVGEPTNPSALGQEIKIGRRGSLTGRLTVIGRQGHVAYPALARNPITGLLRALAAVIDEPLDDGTPHFEPSNIEVTTVDVANPAENVIPARASARFNVRYNDRFEADGLRALIAERIGQALAGTGLSHDLGFTNSSAAFLTEPGPLAECMLGAVRDVTGAEARLTTSGGTSDARFIKDHCPVIEFGLVNATIHQVDENTTLADLERLSEIYRRFIARYFETFD